LGSVRMVDHLPKLRLAFGRAATGGEAAYRKPTLVSCPWERSSYKGRPLGAGSGPRTSSEVKRLATNWVPKMPDLRVSAHRLRKREQLFPSRRRRHCGKKKGYEVVKEHPRKPGLKTASHPCPQAAL